MLKKIEKEISPDLIPPPSIYIHVCTLYSANRTHRKIMHIYPRKHACATVQQIFHHGNSALRAILKLETSF